MRLPIRQSQVLWLKGLIHTLSLGLAAVTFYQAIYDQLGGDPVEALLHFTGIGALNLLLLSLAVSPLAKHFKAANLLKIRRLLGLYAFFYALLHIASYLLFELQLAWGLLLSEIIKRPYITVGFVALMILLALAATSTKGIQRKMGKSWQRLHNWVYLALLLAALHYIWSVKSDLSQPLLYWGAALGLLWFRRQRLTRWLKQKATQPQQNTG